MLKSEDIEIEDMCYSPDDVSTDLLEFQFRCSGPFGVTAEEADCDWVDMLFAVNPFNGNVTVEFGFFTDGCGEWERQVLTYSEKEAFLKAAERFTEQTEGLTMAEFCLFMERENA